MHSCIFQTYIDFFTSITKTNIAALVMSSICILIMALIKEFVNPKVKKVIKMPVPIELIMVSTSSQPLRYTGFL